MTWQRTVPLCGPLDIVPGATIAYSMRKTYQTYTGALFQVVTSVGAKFFDVYPGSTGVVPKDSIIQRCPDPYMAGGYLWYDQTGHGYTATAYSTTVTPGLWQPVTGWFTPWTNSISMTFLGTTYYMTTPEAAAAISQPFTIIIGVKDQYPQAAANANFTDGVDADTRVMMTCATDTGTKFSIYAGSNTLSYEPASTSVTHSYAAVFNGASSYGYIDGVQVLSGDPGSNAFNQQYIGAGYGAGGAYALQGHMGEFLVYSGALTAAQIQAIATNQLAYFQ